VNYTYDTNPYDPSFSQYSWGRMTAVTFNDTTPAQLPIYYEYSYNQAGRTTGQRLRYSNWTNFDATYAWDNLGRMTSLGYPLGGPTYASQYDSMGRLSGMTQASQSVAAAN
jgi:hypothetical protein